MGNSSAGDGQCGEGRRVARRSREHIVVALIILTVVVCIGYFAVHEHNEALRQARIAATTAKFYRDVELGARLREDEVKDLAAAGTGVNEADQQLSGGAALTPDDLDFGDAGGRAAPEGRGERLGRRNARSIFAIAPSTAQSTPRQRAIVERMARNRRIALREGHI